MSGIRILAIDSLGPVGGGVRFYGLGVFPTDAIRLVSGECGVQMNTSDS